MTDERLKGFGCINEMLGRYGEYTQWPRFTFPLDSGVTVVFKLLRNGRNARGTSIELNDEWMGYIKADTGEFDPSRQCRSLERADKEDLWSLLTDLKADPEETFAGYGIKTGTCCVCARTLTNPESVAAGIGPTCAERLFG